MVTLSKMIILWWLLIALQVSFNFIAPNIITKQKVFLGRSTKRIGAINEAFEYKKTKTKSNQKCCDYREKQIMSDYSYLRLPETQGAFSNKFALDIDGLTDELMLCLSCKKYLFDECK